MSTNDAGVTIEEVTTKVMQLRERKAAKKKEIGEIDTVIEKLENHLLKAMQDAGLASMSVLTESGKVTVYHKTDEKVRVADWDEVVKFVETNRAYHILYKNVNSAEVKALRDSGTDVPGISVFKEEVVGIRKS